MPGSRTAGKLGATQELGVRMMVWDYRQVTVRGQMVSAIDGQAMAKELPYATMVNELHADGWALERELSVSQECATVQFRRARSSV
jgi:hypothetical protein